MSKTTRRFVRKRDLNNTIHKLDITDVQKNPANHSRTHIFLNAQGTFTRIDHILIRLQNKC